MALPGEQTRVVVRQNRASPAEWDRFARRCGASFRSAYRAGGAWQLEHHWLYRMRRFEVFQESPRGEKKIGQCAVGVGRRVCAFSDGLQLLPGRETLWPDAMAAVLATLGAAGCVYGSEWSLEPPREETLAAIAGVRIDAICRTDVQAIDFRRWASFELYLKDVSSNARRNAKKAEKSHASLKVLVKAGPARLWMFAKSVALRRTLFRRKGVRRSTAAMVLRSAARLAALSRYTRTAYLVADDDLVASYVGVHFGEQFAYLEGASDPDAKGAAWYLLLAMIEQAYRQSDGQGVFVMGSDDGTQAGVPAWEGLRRSRTQCCATGRPTSVVRFTYRSPLTTVALPPQSVAKPVAERV